MFLLGLHPGLQEAAAKYLAFFHPILILLHHLHHPKARTRLEYYPKIDLDASLGSSIACTIDRDPRLRI